MINKVVNLHPISRWSKLGKSTKNVCFRHHYLLKKCTLSLKKLFFHQSILISLIIYMLHFKALISTLNQGEIVSYHEQTAERTHLRALAILLTL